MDQPHIFRVLPGAELFRHFVELRVGFRHLGLSEELDPFDLVEIIGERSGNQQADLVIHGKVVELGSSPGMNVDVELTINEELDRTDVHTA
jgi:hypothetical protein